MAGFATMSPDLSYVIADDIGAGQLIMMRHVTDRIRSLRRLPECTPDHLLIVSDAIDQAVTELADCRPQCRQQLRLLARALRDDAPRYVRPRVATLGGAHGG